MNDTIGWVSCWGCGSPILKDTRSCTIFFTRETDVDSCRETAGRARLSCQNLSSGKYRVAPEVTLGASLFIYLF